MPASEKPLHIDIPVKLSGPMSYPRFSKAPSSWQDRALRAEARAE